MTALLAILFTWCALAQQTQDYTLDIERFRPPSDAHGYAVVEGASTLEHLQMGVGLWGNYSEDSVLLVWEDSRVLGGRKEDGDAVIDNRSMADLQFGMGISKYFSFTIDAPVVLWQEGYEPAFADNPNRSEELIASGFSDLRFSPKVVFLDLDDYPVGLALVPRFTAPIGPSRSFLGEGEVTATPMAIIEFADASVHQREYRARAAINVGYRVREQARFRDLVVRNEFIYRLGLGIHPVRAVELGVDVNGAYGGPREAQHYLEVLPWIKLIPANIVTITAGGGIGVLPGLGDPDMRIFLGATLGPSFDPSKLDRDKDGIPNSIDQCKNIPEDFDGYQDEDGCPDEDNDKDGIPDRDDQCPDDPEDRDGFKDQDGCPDHDNDKDGIPDVADRCENEPETFNEYQDDDGCPDDKPQFDTDGDGYRDDVDRCPFDAEDFDDWEDEDGCPERDNDLDGIADEVDLCRNDREVYNGFEDEDGCPDEAPQRVFVEKERIRITEKIFFEVDKAVIQVVSYELLDEIAATIVAHPEIRLLRVEGHTDWDGDDAYNLRLSQDRAESVVQFLVDAGVERGRLDPAGFGESRPIATNETPEGKAMNRRVEFLIIERE